MGQSYCFCGHVGDVSTRLDTDPLKIAGKPNEHAGPIGHGKCLHPGCTCEQFTWREYIRGEN